MNNFLNLVYTLVLLSAIGLVCYVVMNDEREAKIVSFDNTEDFDGGF